MPFKVGLNPVIRTQKYLNSGKVYFHEKIQIFSCHYTAYKERHKGLEDFCTWHLPQIQYKNPNVQCIVIPNLTPNPFIRCFLDDTEEVIIDVDCKDRREILNHVIAVLGKPTNILKEELLAKEKKENPANFGYMCRAHCICQVVGQVPCPGIVPVPKEYRGKWIVENLKK